VGVSCVKKPHQQSSAFEDRVLCYSNDLADIRMPRLNHKINYESVLQTVGGPSLATYM